MARKGNKPFPERYAAALLKGFPFFKDRSSNSVAYPRGKIAQEKGVPSRGTRVSFRVHNDRVNWMEIHEPDTDNVFSALCVFYMRTGAHVEPTFYYVS